MLNNLNNLMKFEEMLNENFDRTSYYGFVYLTHCVPNDKYYLGKKVYEFNRNVKLGKKEIQALPKTRGRTKSTKLITKESDWKTYYGSHPTIKKWLSEYSPQDIKRYVVKLCKTKKELTYWENKYLYSLGVLEPGSKFINDNISGTLFKKDLI